MNPKCVLCNYLGLLNFIYGFIGAFILLKWLNVANNDVSLFNVYATPVFTTYPSLLLPQFPVANALSISFDIYSPSKNDFISSDYLIFSIFVYYPLNLLPPFIYFSNAFLAFYLNYSNDVLNTPIIIAPAISNLFLP